MDKQKTPTQPKRSKSKVSTSTQPNRQTHVPPTNLSPTGAYIPHMASPTGSYHQPTNLTPTDWVIPPSAAVYDPFVYQMYMNFVESQSTPPPNIHEPRETEETLSPLTDRVPETQPTTPPSPPRPETSRGKGKGKEKAKEPKKKFETRAAPKMWKPDEEIELAKAWASTSEDSVKDDFWNSVKLSFETRTQCGPNYRSVHQIRSKCVSLNSTVLKFCNIYNNAKSARKSGEGDVDLLARTRTRYQQDYGRPFVHEHVWEVLKDHEKFLRTPLITSTHRPTKRSKTSESQTPTTDTSDAHGPLNVDDEDEDEEEDERPRPLGRNAARAASSASTGSASGDSVSVLLSSLNTLNTKTEELIEARRKDHDIRERELRFREQEAEEKKRRRDYKFYVSSHRDLSGGALETTLAMKEELRQKYGWPPLN